MVPPGAGPAPHWDQVPFTMCLYSAASIFDRSASAAAQSFFSRSATPMSTIVTRIADQDFAAIDMFSPQSSHMHRLRGFLQSSSLVGNFELLFQPELDLR